MGWLESNQPYPTELRSKMKQSIVHGPKTKVALIQLRAEKGDISQNIRNHLTWIKRVAAHRPALIVFPELSLTGYEPTLAKELAMTIEDSRLEPFQQMSDQLQTIIAIGAPLRTDMDIQIGMVIFHPNQPKCSKSFARSFWDAAHNIWHHTNRLAR